MIHKVRHVHHKIVHHKKHLHHNGIHLKPILIFLFLTIAVGFGVYLAQNPTFFKPEAANGDPDIIPDQYIVVLKDGEADPEVVAQDMKRSRNIEVRQVYRRNIKGYTAKIAKNDVEKIRADKRVLFMTQDKIVRLSQFRPRATARPKATPTIRPTPTVRPTATASPIATLKPTATPTGNTQIIPTGVARVGTSVLNGRGINVAVIDSGIDITHPDLNSNIAGSYNCMNPNAAMTDGYGHGTHVAGIIAAQNDTQGVVGVAPLVKLYGVKVFDDQGVGSWSSVICGIDWVTANSSTYNIKVANMSLAGGGASDNNCGLTNQDALHYSICQSTKAGVTYVVAAGNYGQDVRNFIPASYDDTVITVSALADSDGKSGGLGPLTSSGADDTISTMSNFGSLIDFAAPGIDINSTYVGGQYIYMSGTSMASPHVAGVVARYIQKYKPTSWLQIRDALKAYAEPLNAGHTDPSGVHPEPVIKSSNF